MKGVKAYKIMIEDLLLWEHYRLQAYKKLFIKMDVICCERKIFKSLSQNLIQESINLPQTHRIVFSFLGAEDMKIFYFELNGCSTENVATTTKFLTFFACLTFLHLYANFYLILRSNSLTKEHLNI